jgi:hypothetical protein
MREMIHPYYYQRGLPDQGQCDNKEGCCKHETPLIKKDTAALRTCIQSHRSSKLVQETDKFTVTMEYYSLCSPC